MGTGTSNVGKRSGGSGGSGSKYKNFMKMTDDQKAQVISDILNDDSIVVPNYLDNSEFTKVLYGLGMTEKPELVSDAQLDAMSGTELFRTVYDNDDAGITTKDIYSQIAKGDYTVQSGQYSSAHGRSLYFADDFTESTAYQEGSGSKNLVMRAKLKSTAKVTTESALVGEISRAARRGDKLAIECQSRGKSVLGLYALSKGYDAYTFYSYNMVVNRGALAMSTTAKKLNNGGDYARTWSECNGTKVNLK